ncbi:MAG: aminotransferase class I/II-fold pyridoxal phosphate-dependent enzyme [Bacillota bacterium]|nr:aminotransferase class I/II-fold pyridoxal phosphate-dependent enzyme [Bacillota bacterium]
MEASRAQLEAMETEGGAMTVRNLADFYELPDRDIFAKTRPFWEFTEELKEAGQFFYRRTLVDGSANRTRIFDPLTGKVREMVMMASNNYLGLTTHPKVVEAGIKAQEKYGAGSGSVSLLAGTLDLHRELEERLARFKGCEDAIVFPTGYSTNVGCVSGLLRKGDVAINDRLNHASLIDGCKLSGADIRTFRHNDMKSLGALLEKCDEEYNGKLIIVDGVFSMDGDIAPLPEILALARNHGARVMIDEAHATGVIGEHGRGTPEHWHLEGQIDLVAGTLSKGLGGIGGFVASTKEVVNYLRFFGRSYMFSTSLPPAVSASLIAALEVIETEPELRQRLWDNIRYFTGRLRELGFDLGNAETAIVPVIVGDDTKVQLMCREMHQAGIFLNPVAYPAVPKRLARLRLSLMATHTKEDLDQTLDALERVGRKYGVI